MQRPNFSTLKIWLCLSLIVAAASGDAAAQSKSKSRTPKGNERVVLKCERDYLAPLGSEEVSFVVGAKIDVVLQNGKRLEGEEVTDIQYGKNKQTFRSFGVKSAKGKRQKLRPTQILQIVIANQFFDVLIDSESKDYVLLDNQRRDEVVSDRLRQQGRQLWRGADDESRAAAVEEYRRDYIEKSRDLFNDREMQLHETKFFLFLTDMPVDQVGGYIANLDRMYLELCPLFGISKETNIWRGKCVVVAFLEKSSFSLFETKVIGTTAPESAQGLCHSFGNGKVVISCYRGNSPTFFANLLVHETTHGFLHLYRSNVNVPSWLNEGMAEWVANLVVPESNTVPGRQREAIPRVQKTGSLGGMFDSPGNIEGWQYGLASGLAQFLIDANPAAYGGLFTLIKEGATWQEALQELYGLTPERLATEYGRTIGVPALQP